MQEPSKITRENIQNLQRVFYNKIVCKHHILHDYGKTYKTCEGPGKSPPVTSLSGIKIKVRKVVL